MVQTTNILFVGRWEKRPEGFDGWRVQRVGSSTMGLRLGQVLFTLTALQEALNYLPDTNRLRVEVYDVLPTRMVKP